MNYEVERIGDCTLYREDAWEIGPLLRGDGKPITLRMPRVPARREA